MSTNAILVTLILSAAVLLVGGVVLIAVVIALWWALGRPAEDELVDEVSVSAQRPLPPVSRPPPRPSAPPSLPPLDADGLDPVPVPLPSPARGAPPPRPARRSQAPVEDDGGKTEVFQRGTLHGEWDDEHAEGEATEIFRPGQHDIDFSYDP